MWIRRREIRYSVITFESSLTLPKKKLRGKYFRFLYSNGTIELKAIRNLVSAFPKTWMSGARGEDTIPKFNTLFLAPEEILWLSWVATSVLRRGYDQLSYFLQKYYLEHITRLQSKWSPKVVLCVRKKKRKFQGTGPFGSVAVLLLLWIMENIRMVRLAWVKIF